MDVREYPLIPERNWEVDLPALEQLIDHRSAAIIINNPSNPCGAVFSKSHLEKILKVCGRKRLPIIADEIYESVVFQGTTWHSLASVNESVGLPVLTVGGLAKRFLVPGWRMGWIVIHDRNGILAEVREGLHRLASLIVGPSSLVQVALPSILENVPSAWHSSNVAKLQSQFDLCFRSASTCPGLTPYPSQGAMYMMVKINLADMRGISSDIEFTQRLMDEENVVVLPGTCFNAPGFIRITFCASESVLEEVRSFRRCIPSVLDLTQLYGLLAGLPEN